MRSLQTNSKQLLVALMLALFMLPACSGEVEPDQDQTEEIQAQVSIAQEQEILSHKTFNGTLRSEVRSEIGTKVMGEVEAVPVQIGDKVSKGTLILKIKDDDLEAKKEQAEAGLEEAQVRMNAVEKDYNRFKTLYEQGSATPKEWDDIRTSYQSIKSRVKGAESQLKEINDLLSYTQIKAPYDGVIASKYVQAGDIVSPGRPLMAVEQTGRFKIKASLPESEISSIQQGDTVRVKIPAVSADDLYAVVTEVSASGNPQSRQFEVEFRLNPTSGLQGLRSGMFAEIMLQDHSAAIVAVPSEALVKRGQLVGIYTLSSKDESLLRWIRTGRTIGNEVEVLSGLQEGERYVANGRSITRDGIKVVSQN